MSSLPSGSDLTSHGGVSVAGAAWSALASLIAGAPVYRMATRDGKYPRPKYHPKISQTLPSRPAAVMVHGVDGSVTTLCLDLDTSKAAKLVVERDAQRIRALLRRLGISFIGDSSPSGGRHIYIPLAEQLPFERSRDLVLALERRFASLDPIPHLNATDGCIRPPGAVHKLGGHQVLDSPLADAVEIMRLRRNPLTVIEALEAELAPELFVVRKRGAAADRNPAHWEIAETGIAGDRNTILKQAEVAGRDGAVNTPAAAGSRGNSLSVFRQIGRTGVYDRGRYPSNNEARMAVLTHLAASGWTYAQVLSSLTTELVGLAALFGPTKRLQRLLPIEWAKALDYTRNNNGSHRKPVLKSVGKESSLKNHTSRPIEHGGGDADELVKKSSRAIQQEISDLENLASTVMDARLARLGRQGIGLRLLLRGLIGYARARGSVAVDVGCRSLAIATGKDHGTIARLLPQLEQLTDGLVSRVERGRGKNADLYLLQVPAKHRGVASALSWRKGKSYAVRPVFRAIGESAALVYEWIERSEDCPTTAKLVAMTGIGRTAVDNVLTTMASLGMIERPCPGAGWKIITSCKLTRLAEQLGVLEDVGTQITKYRKERQKWHAWLDRHRNPTLDETELWDETIETEWIPPADDDPALMVRIWTAA